MGPAVTLDQGSSTWNALTYPLVEIGLVSAIVRAIWSDRVSWRGISYRVVTGGLMVREGAGQS